MEANRGFFSHQIPVFHCFNITWSLHRLFEFYQSTSAGMSSMKMSLESKQGPGHCLRGWCKPHIPNCLSHIPGTSWSQFNWDGADEQLNEYTGHNYTQESWSICGVYHAEVEKFVISCLVCWGMTDGLTDGKTEGWQHAFKAACFYFVYYSFWC